MKWITISRYNPTTILFWLSNIILAALREILQTCQAKELKSKLGVAYIFGLRELVHLFYLAHFLCPPQFICPGLWDSGLGCSALYIWTRAVEGRGNCSTKTPVGSSQTFKHGSVCGDKMFTSAGSFPAAQAAQALLDLHSGTAKNTESQRRRVCDRCRKKQKTWQLQEVNKPTVRSTSIRKRQMETKGGQLHKARSSYRKHTLWYFSHWPLVHRSGGWGAQGLCSGPICMACPWLCGHVQHLAPRQAPTPLCGGQSGRLGSAFDPGPSIHL